MCTGHWSKLSKLSTHPDWRLANVLPSLEGQGGREEREPKHWGIRTGMCSAGSVGSEGLKVPRIFESLTTLCITHSDMLNCYASMSRRKLMLGGVWPLTFWLSDVLSDCLDRHVCLQSVATAGGHWPGCFHLFPTLNLNFKNFLWLNLVLQQNLLWSFCGVVRWVWYQ